MVDTLATAEDVESRLGRSLTDSEWRRVDALLADASANVRQVSTQQFTTGTSTVTLTPSKRGRVRLPQRPIVAIASVKDLAGNDVAYLQVGEELRLSGSPLNSFEIEPWRFGSPAELVVEYDHGDDTVPPDIVGVVCAVVARALGMKAEAPAGIGQQTIDGYSETAGGGVATSSVIAQGPLGLLPSELAICERYVRPRSPISTLA